MASMGNQPLKTASIITLFTYKMSNMDRHGSTAGHGNKPEDIIVRDRDDDTANFQARIQANPSQYIKLHLLLRCKSCESNGGDCYVQRTLEHPYGDASARCARCRSSTCSLVKPRGVRARARVQSWLDYSRSIEMASSRDLDIPNPLQSGSTPRADEDRLLPTTPPSATPRPPTVIKVKVPSPSSPAASSSLSELSSTGPMTAPHSSTSTLPSSPPPARDGQGSHSKRSRTDTDSSVDGAAPSNPPAKAARLHATSTADTPSMTEDLTNQFQGKDHEFGRHILGLLVRHESILKTQGTALAAVEDLKQDLSRERKEKKVLVLDQSETRKNNATLVKEKTAAALLAKDKAAEMAWVKKERDEAKTTLLDINAQLKEALKREASLLEREKEREKEREREKTVKEATAAATKREKEAKDITIKGLEKRLAEEERQHNLAVKNADASRHSRNEAQDALAAIQADKDQLTRELEMMTANHENIAIDLEQTRASLERAQADSARLIDVKAELVTIRSELQRLSSANAQLSASAEAIEDLEKKLENMRNVAQDNLDDKNQMEVRLRDARAETVEWKQKGEELRKNYNVAVGNLLKSEMKVKELERDSKEIKREGNGEGQAEGSRAGREIIDMTGA
jgi:hypothetical protein